MTELSPRAEFALRANLHLAPEENLLPSRLAGLTYRDLQAMPGIGRTTAHEIATWLQSFGYEIALPRTRKTARKLPLHTRVWNRVKGWAHRVGLTP